MPAWLIWSTVFLYPHAGPWLTPSHSEATHTSRIDRSLKFLVCRCWLFLLECFWTKAINQISCSSHSSLLYALVLSIWLSHFSSSRGSGGDAEQHQACEGRKAPSWCQRFKPVSLVWSSLVLIFSIGRRSSSLVGCAHTGANAETIDTARAAVKQTAAEKERGWLHRWRRGTFI